MTSKKVAQKNFPDSIHVKFSPEFLSEWTEFRRKHGLTQRFAVANALGEYMLNYEIRSGKK